MSKPLKVNLPICPICDSPMDTIFSDHDLRSISFDCGHVIMKDGTITRRKR